MFHRDHYRQRMYPHIWVLHVLLYIKHCNCRYKISVSFGFTSIHRNINKQRHGLIRKNVRFHSWKTNGSNKNLPCIVSCFFFFVFYQLIQVLVLCFKRLMKINNDIYFLTNLTLCTLHVLLIPLSLQTWLFCTSIKLHSSCYKATNIESQMLNEV